MKIARLSIKNFRGIREATILFPGSAVLVGDNNAGKSTILEAIDLVLGPERLARAAPIDEHDFYAGKYFDSEKNPIPITIEVVMISLNEEQDRHFKDHIEWWDSTKQILLDGPPAEGTEGEGVISALRVGFRGAYDAEEDGFLCKTFYHSPPSEDGEQEDLRTYDKRKCGFLFLRTLRTGSRALSLERGSLLDIILKLQEKHLQMWEDVLSNLRTINVAENPELGIAGILSSVEKSVRTFVHADWAENPHLRVSDMTRETLRKVLTVFMGTGAKLDDGTFHAAPFQHQGTGTINTLVLALLSIIAELKQNVIFAMEEPEIAIPPFTQKQIVRSVIGKSSQALFTSHSPYVLEEFEPEYVLATIRREGTLTVIPTTLPPAVKRKAYRSEMRTRFCEALLARRVLVVEGKTEHDAFSVAAQRLNELNPSDYKTLDAMGIAAISAETDSQVIALSAYFERLGKSVYAIYDKQTPEVGAQVRAAIPYSFECPEKGCERLLVKQTADVALIRFAKQLVAEGEWPTHLDRYKPKANSTIEDVRNSLFEYLRWGKGSALGASLLSSCSADEMPRFVVDTLMSIQSLAEPPKDEEQPSAEGESR